MCVKRRVCMILQCCSLSNNADIFFVYPTKQWAVEEVAIVAYHKKFDEKRNVLDKLYLTKCCKRPLVEIRRLEFIKKEIDENGRACGEYIPKPGIRLDSVQSQKYINKLPSITIWKSEVIQPIYQIENRWYLLYNEYGHIKKCYSTLSSLGMMGKLPSNDENMLDSDDKYIWKRTG